MEHLDNMDNSSLTDPVNILLSLRHGTGGSDGGALTGQPPLNHIENAGYSSHHVRHTINSPLVAPGQQDAAVFTDASIRSPLSSPMSPVHPDRIYSRQSFSDPIHSHFTSLNNMRGQVNSPTSHRNLGTDFRPPASENPHTLRHPDIIHTMNARNQMGSPTFPGRLPVPSGYSSVAQNSMPPPNQDNFGQSTEGTPINRLEVNAGYQDVKVRTGQGLALQPNPDIGEFSDAGNNRHQREESSQDAHYRNPTSSQGSSAYLEQNLSDAQFKDSTNKTGFSGNSILEVTAKSKDSVNLEPKTWKLGDLAKQNIIHVPEKGLQNIVEVCENQVVGQTKVVQEILSLCGKMIGYEYYCHQIMTFCNQIISETLNSSNTVINLCQSFKQLNLGWKTQDQVQKVDKGTSTSSLTHTDFLERARMEEKAKNVDKAKSVEKPETLDKAKTFEKEKVVEKLKTVDKAKNVEKIDKTRNVEKSKTRLKPKAEPLKITLSVKKRKTRRKSHPVKLPPKETMSNDGDNDDEVDREDIDSFEELKPEEPLKDSDPGEVSDDVDEEDAEPEEEDADPEYLPKESERKQPVKKRTTGRTRCARKKSGKDDKKTLSEPHTCPVCNKTYKSKKLFLKHEKLHFQEGSVTCGKTQKIGKKCDLCDVVCYHPSDIKRHMRKHTGEKPYVCEICGKGFAIAHSLKTHLMIHSDYKPFSCDKCDYVCRTEKVLKLHSVIHSGEKKFQCDECGKQFGRNDSLINHLKIHAAVKPFACESCPKRFSRKWHLKQHEKIHTDVMPYACEICGKRSRQAYNIVVHMRTHTRAKPFKCEVCGKQFAHSVSLRQHSNICRENTANNLKAAPAAQFANNSMPSFSKSFF